MNKKNKQTELSYYGLYLLNHLRENRFPQAADADFIRERADHAAEVYEQARRSDLFADAAQVGHGLSKCNTRTVTTQHPLGHE